MKVCEIAQGAAAWPNLREAAETATGGPVDVRERRQTIPEGEIVEMEVFGEEGRVLRADYVRLERWPVGDAADAVAAEALATAGAPENAAVLAIREVVVDGRYRRCGLGTAFVADLPREGCNAYVLWPVWAGEPGGGEPGGLFRFWTRAFGRLGCATATAGVYLAAAEARV